MVPSAKSTWLLAPMIPATPKGGFETVRDRRALSEVALLVNRNFKDRVVFSVTFPNVKFWPSLYCTHPGPVWCLELEQSNRRATRSTHNVEDLGTSIRYNFNIRSEVTAIRCIKVDSDSHCRISWDGRWKANECEGAGLWSRRSSVWSDQGPVSLFREY